MISRWAPHPDEPESPSTPSRPKVPDPLAAAGSTTPGVMVAVYCLG